MVKIKKSMKTKLILEKVENFESYQVFFPTYPENKVFLGTFDLDHDGFYYYWPVKDMDGCWSYGTLLHIGEALKELNRPYEENIKEYFRKQKILDRVIEDLRKMPAEEIHNYEITLEKINKADMSGDENNLYNWVFWKNTLEKGGIWYAIERDSYLLFMNGNRKDAVFLKSKDISVLESLITHPDILKRLNEQEDGASEA